MEVIALFVEVAEYGRWDAYSKVFVRGVNLLHFGELHEHSNPIGETQVQPPL